MPRRKAHKSRDSDAGESALRPFWSGTISFGLVSVPVNLFPANQSGRTPLRLLGPNGEPLARKYYSPKTERDLEAEDMVRGYEIAKEKYVVVTDDELERLAPEKTRDIAIISFVDKESVPPVHFDRGYFLTPDAKSEKAYRLLVETLEKSGLAGIATFVMRGKEYLVAILADHGILRAETMRFADELRSPAEVGLPKKKKVPRATVLKFERLIGSKSKKQPSKSQLEDDQADRLKKLIAKKRSQRRNIVEVETDESDGRKGKVIDLVAVLKRNLAGKKKAAR